MGDDSDSDSDQDKDKKPKKVTPKQKKKPTSDDADETEVHPKKATKPKTKTPKKKLAASDDAEDEQEGKKKLGKNSTDAAERKKSPKTTTQDKSKKGNKASSQGDKLNLDPTVAAMIKKRGITLHKVIHPGRHSLVYRAESKDIDKPVAVRVIFLDKIKRDTMRQRQKFLPREIATLCSVRHKHVIHVHDIFRAGPKVIIVMELLKDGSVSEYLTVHGALQEAKAVIWFADIASAVKHLHEDLHIAHRNIKTDNILLDEDAPKLSLAGFPIDAWDFQEEKPFLSSTMCGTHQYKSPQLARGKPYDPFAADNWAMGVVLFQLLNAAWPFTAPNNDKDAMVAQQTNPEHLKKAFIKTFSPELVKLLQGLFIEDEKTRMTMAQALKHPWVKKHIETD